MSTEPNKCARCRQPLPKGSGFCVACGCNHDLATLERAGKVDLALDQRQRRLGFWKRMVDAVPFLRIFR